MSQLLSNDTITLRALEPTDLDMLYQWENDTALWVVSDTIAPYSRKALWQYLQEDTGDIYAQRQLRLIITLTSDGTAVGTVDFLNFDPLNNRAELGLFITKEMRGKGLGRGSHHGLRPRPHRAQAAVCLHFYRQLRVPAPV